MELSVSEHGEDAVPVVSVSGEVDVYAAPELRERLTEILAGGRSGRAGAVAAPGRGGIVGARRDVGRHRHRDRVG